MTRVRGLKRHRQRILWGDECNGLDVCAAKLRPQHWQNPAVLRSYPLAGRRPTWVLMNVRKYIPILIPERH
jgi:hypothetical protein